MFAEIDFIKIQYKKLEALYPEAAEIYQEVNLST